jgi:muramoyltetrapeptide carboxypeptidase
MSSIFPTGYDKKPRSLQTGDLVRVVSPSGPADEERVRHGVAVLEAWGLRVEVAPHALDRTGYLGGLDADRRADLNAAFADPRVRAIWATRGGYGMQRIVDGLDFDAVRADPKLFIGFSDLTALQLALFHNAGLPSLHGPGVTGVTTNAGERLTEASMRSLRSAMTSAEPVVIGAAEHEETAAVHVPGPVAEGTLLGGNLTLVVASIGTPDQPDLRDAILLLEDVTEAPYRIDRMLTQFRRAGLADGLAGVAVGQFTKCRGRDETTVVDVLGEALAAWDVPVLGGLPVGHGDGQLTVPFGTRARLDVNNRTLTVEAAVVD